jgi:glycolate oxidase
MNYALDGRVCYSYDAVVEGFLPDIVVFPTSTEQIVDIMRYAHPRSIPVVPRGAGSGCCGGGLSARGGILLSFENMDRVLSIDEELRIGVAEPGVITANFQRQAERAGLFYPPDPSSAEISTLGGNVAHGAGGLRGRKYGTTRDYVLGLEAVTTSGDLLQTGFFAPGQVEDLTGLLVGSEGTLAIVTKIALMLLPLPESFSTQLFVFSKAEQAIRMARSILHAGLMPSAMEYMDDKAMACVRDYGGVVLPAEDGHVLLVEFAGRGQETRLNAEAAGVLGKDADAVSGRTATTSQERQRIWSVRRALSPAMAHAAAKKISQDVCVPPRAIAALLKEIEILAGRHDLLVIVFGHLGDGNLHVNFLTDGGSEQTGRVQDAVEDLFRYVLDFGGTLSGEHGIGLTKAKYLHWELSRETIEAHRKVKDAFDNRGMLNPDKIFCNCTTSVEDFHSAHVSGIDKE